MKKCPRTRQIEFLSLCMYRFSATNVPWAHSAIGVHINQWPVLSVEATEVSVSSANVRLPQWRSEPGVHYVALLLMAGVVQTFRQGSQLWSTGFLWLLCSSLQKHTWEQICSLAKRNTWSTGFFFSLAECKAYADPQSKAALKVKLGTEKNLPCHFNKY